MGRILKVGRVGGMLPLSVHLLGKYSTVIEHAVLCAHRVLVQAT